MKPEPKHNNVVPMTTDEGGFGVVDDDPYNRIEPGIYEAAFVRYETAKMFKGASKLVLWFKITTMGPYFEKEIPKFYNVRALIGTPACAGRFRVGRRCDFLMDFMRLFPDRQPARLDRIPMAEWKNHLFDVKVREVASNHQQQRVPSALRYSVIDKIIEVSQ